MKFRIDKIGVLALLLFAISLPAFADNDVITDFAGADVNIGERLFLETRFSQYFFTNCNGDANASVPGDPTVAFLNTITNAVPGPFAGLAMNCRQCHIVDEEGYGPFGNGTLGNRTYADFTTRSPVPLRDDGRTFTPRNSLELVDAFIPHNGPLFLHNDGQFASAHDLIIGTLTGRNYGWKPSEYATAVHHIANIIRNDDGMGYLATEARGGRFQIDSTYLATYQNIFAGFTNYEGSYVYDPRAFIADFISPEYTLDMRYATDDQILNTAASLIESYLRNLFFSQATNGLDFTGNGTAIFNGSPFDTFLIKNNLPQIPNPGETPIQYSQRLLQLLNQLADPQFVTDPDDGTFTTHVQTFQFGTNELAGLKIFLTTPMPGSGPPNPNINVGNCATCHSPPAFTDFIFHNTGASQEEYDAINGTNSFMQLSVPDLETRATNYDAWLPPTTNHPDATGIFETPPTTNNPAAADLGLWNVYANPDFPAPQPGLQQITPQLLGMSVAQIAGLTLNSQQFNLSGSNGPPGMTYYILASHDFTLPANGWTVISTNHFDPQGNFSFTANLDPAAAQTFYKIAQPLPPPDQILPLTIARFKTPNLRDLGHSDPYLHTGRKDTLEDVIQFYQQFSGLARVGQVRNADPQLLQIHLDNTTIAPLAAFLRSLNEDYTD